MAGLLFQIITVFFTIDAVFGEFQEIHHQMSPEERLIVFRTAGTDVPPYEIVEIQSSRIHKRAAEWEQNIKFTAFGQEIEHYLTPVNDILVNENTPIKEAKTNWRYKTANITDSSVTMAMISKHIYQDELNAITLSIKDHRGRREVSGYIGYKNWHVSPVPDRLRKSLNLNRSQRSVDEDEDRVYHIIHKIPNLDGQIDEEPFIKVERSTRSVEARKDSTDSNKTAYPEILVIVDYDLYWRFNKNMVDTITYVVAFWNGVDMLFRDLKNPRVRLNIHSIIVAQDEFVLSYIKRRSSGEVFASFSLNSKKDWLWKMREQIPLDDYDASLTMIDTFTMVNIVNNTFKYGIIGIAGKRSVCWWGQTEDESRPRVYKVGITRDIGNFVGIRTAAHEIGHILGADHDGEEQGAGCEKRDGALLNALLPNSISKYSHSFSNCSKNQFSEFMNTTDCWCLWNKPGSRNDISLPRILPGKLISLESQCRGYGQYSNPIKEISMCRSLKCRTADRSSTLNTGVPAADGTSCADKKICFEGYCVDKKDVIGNVSGG